MKKLVIICALLISAVSFTKAQGQRTPEEMAAMTLDGQRLATLNLTADQKAKLTPMLVAYNKATMEAMTKARAAGGDMQTAMADLRTKMAPTIAENEKAAVALLTADQKKAYDAALAAAKERNPNASSVFFGGFGRGGGGQR